ncbi:hypothetical protein L486_06723 [Kwoniella mangroviensis CBS 10435]|uniref:Zn(2)-C6 fungal-type domain-containing protein n=1 Tax=Kwoniella mangroviensis CBS 10435 TaxID=1331196 RepID=A0A1B9IJZ4_9TREE|nr:hypothetical protein L486_06723 [Kwoniella mangroviensis CBS 10435]
MSDLATSSGAPSGHDPAQKNMRKVTHIAKACVRCRRRKVRCNGEHPCAECAEKEADCIYEKDDRRRTKSDMDDVKDRIARLERMLQRPSSVRSESNTLNRNSSSPPPSAQTARSGLSIPTESLNDSHFSNFVNLDSLPADSGPSISNLRESNTTSSSSGYPDSALSSSHFDRLKSTSGNGPSVQYGATSIWTHDNYDAPTAPSNDSRGPELLPGEWIDWGKNLPPTLMRVLTKTIHDRAIDHYAAYYASWCMVLDSEAFKRDLVICNISSIDLQPSSSPKWTSHYSPFLHNVILGLGLYYNREAWPEAFAALKECFVDHCTRLFKQEFERPPLSALRAVNLFATWVQHLLSTYVNANCPLRCLNQPPMGAHDYGYTYYGMTVAMIQVLGLNINCEAYVTQGRMSRLEYESRNAAYWAAYLYDLLRSISAGRNPMIAIPRPEIPFPVISGEVDDTPWCSSASSIGQETRLGHTLNGIKSMRSTVFHWTARLGCLLAKVVDTLYSTKNEPVNRDEVIDEISSSLNNWYNEQPFADPKFIPLPHVILLHIAYHLTRIFLFRPFYRSNVTSLEVSPASQCDRAAKSILGLLKLYDRYHGLRYGVGTFMNATFTSATVFLLRAVEDQADPVNLNSRQSSKDIEEITYFMSQLAITFHEAGRGLNILQSLCSEWLPSLASNREDTGLNSQVEAIANGIPPSEMFDLQNGDSGNAVPTMGYQNFLAEFPMDDSFYNALLSFVGVT